MALAVMDKIIEIIQAQNHSSKCVCSISIKKIQDWMKEQDNVDFEDYFKEIKDNLILFCEGKDKKNDKKSFHYCICSTSKDCCCSKVHNTTSSIRMEHSPKVDKLAIVSYFSSFTTLDKGFIETCIDGNKVKFLGLVLANMKN